MVEPSDARRKLGAELRKLRSLAGLGQRAVAAELGVAQSSVLRMERGQQLPSRPQFDTWVRVVGAGEQVAGRAAALLDLAHGETRPWSVVFDAHAHAQTEARQRNEAATLIRNFQPTLVPGLLQTAGYAKAVLERGRSRDVPAALAARLERQSVLYEEGRRFEFVIAESAMRWTPTAQARRGLADRIVSVASLPSVQVMVLPDEVGLRPPGHNFVIRDSPEYPAYVTVELVHGAQEILDDETVELYLDLWEQLVEVSVRGDEALVLVQNTLAATS